MIIAPTDIVLAIDPGVEGGLAWRDANGTVHCQPMPKTIEKITAAVHQIAPTKAAIELVGGYIGGDGQPGSRMFTFGQNDGACRAALITAMRASTGTHDVTLTSVPPATWQHFHRLFGASTETRTAWKNRLKSCATDLYPLLRVTLKTADALLILNYLLNRHVKTI